MKNLLVDNKSLPILIAQLLITILLNNLIFSKQLDYGFRDVDWQVLYYFKIFGNLSLDHLLNTVKVFGVYAPESYYVGLLEKFIGLNFVQLHLVTHIFKIFASISVYFLILTILKRRLLAFITSLLYTVSYAHAGVLFQLSSGGYFLATIIMIFFLISYYFSLSSKNVLKWSLVSGSLLITSLLLKPERMYPLLFFVILLEFFLIILNRFKKELWIRSLKRTILILLPILIFYFFYNTLFKSTNDGFSPNQFSVGTNLRLTSIMEGNIQLILYPFASFGSLFLFGDHWKILGELNFIDLGVYITSLIFGPIVRLGIISFILFRVICGKAFKLTLMTSVLVFIFSLIVYVFNVHWQNISLATRIHFDPNLIGIPAIFGFYILVLGCIFFLKWIINHDASLFPVSLGLFFAFLFILLTWLPSDLQLVFMGPQRYLSIPSIGTNLFISGLLVIIYDLFKRMKIIKNFAWMVFLLLFPLIVVNYEVTSKFFDYELTYAGVKATEQIRMKNNFRKIVGKINQKENSLFYFDESIDRDNGYFNEGTIIAGFESWMRVEMDGSIDNFPQPGMIRTTVQCPEHTHQNCIGILKKGLAVVDDQQGIWYQDPIRGNIPHFYKLSNFHAVRFINKDIVDITGEVLKEFNL